jgi:hypothetical protein
MRFLCDHCGRIHDVRPGQCDFGYWVGPKDGVQVKCLVEPAHGLRLTDCPLSSNGIVDLSLCTDHFLEVTGNLSIGEPVRDDG